MINISDLRDFLSKRVRGQPKAIETLCNYIEDMQNLGSIEEKVGPMGVMLELGPSGSGKTELVRCLAQYLYGSKEAMTKIPCGNLTEPHTVHMLTGSPPGYIGYGDPPLLAKKAQNKNQQDQDTEYGVENLGEREIELLNSGQHLAEQNHKLLDEIQDIIMQWSNVNSELGIYGAYMERLLGGLSALKALEELSGRKSEKKQKVEVIGIDKIESNMLAMQIEANSLADLLHKKRLELNFIYQELVSIEAEFQKTDTGASRINDPEPIPIILFDEIEKAHTKIHDFLLDLIENGEVAFSNGTKRSLKNSLIIFTSNVAAGSISNILNDNFIGFRPKATLSSDADYKDRKILAVSEKELKNVFSPAFRSRLDDIIVFRELTPVEFGQILDDHIELFCQALRMKREVELLVRDDVKEFIIQKSLHRPEVGARLLIHKLRSVLKRPFGRELASRPGFKGTVKASLDEHSNLSFEFLVLEKPPEP